MSLLFLPYFMSQYKPSPNEDIRTEDSARRPWRLVLWAVLAVVVIAAGWQLFRLIRTPPAPSSSAAGAALATSSSTPTRSELAAAPAFPTPDPDFVYSAGGGTPAPAGNTPPAFRNPEAPAPPKLAADEVLTRLTPAPGQVGWVGSQETRGNHFGDSFLHVGTVQGQVFHGAIQFDLSRVPRGAPIRYAALQLTGLDDERLDRTAAGAWEVRWLDPQVNADWSRKSFQDIHNAAVVQSILPPVGQANLAPVATNQFVFDSQQLAALQQAVLNGETAIAFRLDGPEAGGDSLFTWDTGYGPATLGTGPALLLVTGPPPSVPPPLPSVELLVVTNTPTPENVLTAAAIVFRATAEATQIGTATPTPLNLVTATPTAANSATADAQRLLAGFPPVVTATPTPASPAEATQFALYATAVAVTTGTYTPTPGNLVTATPTATFVVVTNTPTPGSAAAALAQAVALATIQATAGPPTPFPPWIVTATPNLIVVQPWPTPENAVTAAYLQVYPTIAALTIGTLTPTPPNLATATFTPQPTPVPLLVAMTSLPPTPTFTPQPGGIPDNLRGKLVFRSDNLGTEQFFLLDAACINTPEGCSTAGQFLLTQAYPHRLAWEREAFSPDGQAQLVVQKDGKDVLQIMLRNVATGQTTPLTTFTKGSSYDPVWSPRGDKIAFVSTESGNDEIYTISPDGTNLQRLTFNNWEWDKHPTWSPDGSQIVFHSNRDTGRRQLWVMNADGSGQRRLLESLYNDWDPVWIK